MQGSNRLDVKKKTNSPQFSLILGWACGQNFENLSIPRSLFSGKLLKSTSPIC
jgi:hypothetical protein